MQLSNIPLKLPLPFAAGGSKNTIPEASQIGITNGAASLTDGFPPLTRTALSAGGVPPSGLDMNGILFELSAVVRWANAGGGYPFDNTFASDANVNGYPKGARVMRTDGLGYWLNTTENNTTDPETSGAAAAGWLPDYTTGATAITMTNANVTLTALQYGKPIIVITGVLTANLNLILPSIVDQWLIINNCTGAFTITAKTAAGTGIAIPTASIQTVYGDGTNINSSAPSVTPTNDATYADSSAKPASTSWVRGAMSAIATAAGFAISVGANGYIKFPSWLGSLIIQWGQTLIVTAGTDVTVTLPYGPVSNIRSIVTTEFGSTGFLYSAYTYTTTTFKLHGGTGTSGSVCQWIAICN